MKTHKIGWHMPTGATGMSGATWDVIATVPPVAVIFQPGEAVSSGDIWRVLEINPQCHIFARAYYLPSDDEADLRAYIQRCKEIVTGWGFIPEGQRHLQIFNEQNMPHTTAPGHPRDQWEGFGPDLAAMERFNQWFCTAYDEIKAANPTWKVAFPPLTPGNLDAYFHTDPIGEPYYMHGPEAAKDSLTEEEIAASILSGPCREALTRADEYLAHIYVLNDAEHQMHEPWAGLRFAQYAKFLPRPMDVWITELGIGHPTSNWSRYFDLLSEDDHAYVRGTCIWKLGETIRSAGDPIVQELKRYYNALPDVTPPGPAPPPEPTELTELPEQGQPVQVRGRIGLHWRNDHNSRDIDLSGATAAEAECVRVMGFTNAIVGPKLKESGIEIVVRLWDGRFSPNHIVPPQDFADAVAPQIEAWQPFTGDSDNHSRSFTEWFDEAYDLLRARFPTAKLGFPGLAIPHRDLEWLLICRPAIEKADWLACHVYWQNPTYREGNHLSDDWGRRWVHYRTAYPEKVLYLTEIGNSNSHILGHVMDWSKVSQEYVEWSDDFISSSGVEAGQQVMLAGACFYLISAPQTEWEGFSLVTESGHFRDPILALGQMERPPLLAEVEAEPSPPPPEPGPETPA